MAGWRLAELFVEISTKGNWRQEMDSLQKKFGVSAGVIGNMSKQYANAIGPTKTTIDSLNDMIDQINARTIEVKFLGTDDGEKLLETSRLLRSELERINAIKTMRGAMSEYKSIMAAGSGSDASTSAQPKPMDSTVEEFAAKVKRLQDMKLEVKFLGTDDGEKLLETSRLLRSELERINAIKTMRGAMSEYKSIMAAGSGSDASTSAQPKPMDSTVEEFAAKVKRLQDMKLEVKFLGTDEGKKLLATQKELAKEMGKTNSARNLLVMEGTVGKMSMAMRELKEGMQGFGNQSVVQFGIASASIMGLTRAASPVAFSTLTKSFEILSAQIGTAFLPAIMDASKWIQDTADWVGNLDDEGKKQIGTWAAYGVGLLGIVTLGPRLISMIGMILGPMRSLNAVMSGGISLASSGVSSMSDYANGIRTVGTAASASSGAVLRLGEGFLSIVRANPVAVFAGIAAAAWAMAKAMSAGTDAATRLAAQMAQLQGMTDRLKAGGPMGRSDFEEIAKLNPKLIAKLEAAKGDPDKQREILEAERNRLQNQGNANNQRGDVARNANQTLTQMEATRGNGGAMGTFFSMMRGALSPTYDAAQRDKERGDALRGAGFGPREFSQITPGGFFGTGALGDGQLTPQQIRDIANVATADSTKNEAGLAGVEALLRNPNQIDQFLRGSKKPATTPANAAMGAMGASAATQEQDRQKGVKLDFAGFQSQTMNIEQAWNRIQTAALGKSPAQNELERIQNQNTASIVGAIKNGAKATVAAIQGQPVGVTN